MPVHRHLHDRMGSVYAFRSELDAWARTPHPGRRSRRPASVAAGPAPVDGPPVSPLRTRRVALWASLAVVLLAPLVVWTLRMRGGTAERLFAQARFQPLTDFEGIEQAAALSRDGRFVAFQSDRDGRMDVWVTQLGTGRFTNLTRGTALELVNPSVRTLGFSPDGSQVTFWGPPRRAGAARRSPSGPRRSSAVLRAPTWRAPPSTTGLRTASGWCSTPRLPGTRCSSVAPRRTPSRGKSFPPRPGSTRTSSCGLRTAASCSSSRAPSWIGWTSGASPPPAERPSASPTTTRG